ncbi:MAG: hypothetical protein H0W25_00005 [Acidimicrobiia bacterium]|nr:hypothetical protein [Acidimicrobiia bacterium]
MGDAAGAAVRLEVKPWRTVGAVRDLRRLRSECAARPGLLRSAVGVGRPGEVYFLALWADASGVAALLESPAVAKLHDRLGERFWAIHWVPENEFGQWDGLRVRRERVRRTLAMSPAAAALGDDPPGPGPGVSWRRGADARRRR